MPAEAASPSLVQSALVPYALIFAVFYFLVISPQRKKQNETKAMIDNIKKNDQVITTSGIHGVVVNVKDKTIVLRVDDDARIEFDKEAISSVTKSV